MLLKPKETTVAYRCPECGGGVVAPVGVFALTADKMKLRCPCGKSAMNITLSKDGKIRADVPCFACGGTLHSYTVSSDVFFSRDIFNLSCSLSGFDICFFGREDEVNKALREQENELQAMVEEDLKDEHQNGENEMEKAVRTEQNARTLRRITDADIYNVIRFILTDLEEEHKISCGCPDGEGIYDADCTQDGTSVRVFCQRCGREKLFPVGSVADAEAFLRTDEIRL